MGQRVRHLTEMEDHALERWDKTRRRRIVSTEVAASGSTITKLARPGGSARASAPISISMPISLPCGPFIIGISSNPILRLGPCPANIAVR
jgi:hypothetical protein